MQNLVNIYKPEWMVYSIVTDVAYLSSSPSPMAGCLSKELAMVASTPCPSLLFTYLNTYFVFKTG